MVRRSLSILLALCVLLGATFSVAVAQKPSPPTPLGDITTAPAIDMANLPATITQATALKESLSADQKVAVRQILEKYVPELKAITELLSATPKAAPGEQQQPVDKGIALRLEAMVKSIDGEMALVLDANQLSLFRAGVTPSMFTAQANPQAAAPLGADSYTDNCEYCAYYDAYAKYYQYYGYLYAYYNYYYGSGSYAYYAYYYSYYGYYYAKIALDYSGPTFFSFKYFGNYTTDYPYYAYYYSYYAYYNGYYGYLYSYYDYYYGGGTSYAYYAYLYGYYGTEYGAYYGYYYGYYCYANA